MCEYLCVSHIFIYYIIFITYIMHIIYVAIYKHIYETDYRLG